MNLIQSERMVIPPINQNLSIYQIKVTLKDSHPPIWRRIQVFNHIPLNELHQILQAVMGWTDSHSHLFIIDKTFYGKPDPEYSFEVEDENHFLLGQVISGKNNKFIYEYDFTDCWQHELLVERILLPQSGVPYPICIAGKGARPPEDCGGIWEYRDILEAIEDPDHPQYYDMLKWVENGFDPEFFDLDEINRRLNRLKTRLAR